MFLSHFVYRYVTLLVYDPNATIDIGWVALRCELYFGAAVTSIILTLAITNQKFLIKAIENIIKIDYGMKKIGIKITYRNAQRFAYFQIFGITIVFILKLIIQSFYAKEFYIFVYNVFNVVDYINTIMLFQYVDILLLLRQRYVWLNKEIKEMGKAQTSGLNEFKLTSLQVSGRTSGKNNCVSTEDLLITLGKVHIKLFDTAKLVNRTYGIQLLSSITARFIMITTQLINMYKIIKDPNTDNNITYSLVAIYLFLHVSKIFMIASISENTAAKVWVFCVSSKLSNNI